MGHPLDSIVPGDVAWALAEDGDPDDRLYPEELEAVRRAVEKRRREFAAGRRAARAALAALGFAGGPIPVGRARQPVWPPDALGSIAHSGRHAAAVAARRRRIAALGLDVESDRDYEADLRERIASPDEWDAWSATSLADGRTVERSAGAIFVAKEAVYKAVFPRTSEFLEFRDVRLTFDDDGGFTARADPETRGASAPWVASLSGRVSFGDNAWWAVAWSRPIDDDGLWEDAAAVHTGSDATRSSTLRSSETACGHP